MARKKKLKTASEHWLNLARYHSADIEALLQRYRQVENLIGLQHHSPSEGNHCELLLSDYLRRILPSHYSVDTGFIRGNPIQAPSGDTIVASPQIDILIHNSQEFSPIYRMGNLVVVVPESVFGVIEVKKQITSGQLKDALSNIAKAMEVLMPHRIRTTSQIFTAVVGFDSDMEIDSDTYKNRLNEVMDIYGYPACLPEQITDFSKGMYDLVWDSNKNSTNVVCREAYFVAPGETGKINLSLQYFLYRLMETTQMLELRTPPVTRYSVPQQATLKRRFAITRKK
jgi:hypothetical protein